MTSSDRESLENMAKKCTTKSQQQSSTVFTSQYDSKYWYIDTSTVAVLSGGSNHTRFSLLYIFYFYLAELANLKDEIRNMQKQSNDNYTVIHEHMD